MIYDCLFERSDSALTPFEMHYDYLIEMIFRKQTVFCTPAACSEYLPIESWPNSIGKHPAEKIVCLSFRDDIWLSFRNERQRSRSFWNDISTVLLKWQMIILSKWAIQFCIRFDMIYDCHFEMTAQNFSYRESFSSARTPKILVTKMPLKTYIFVHRFFRGDCPLAAWKYKS